MAQALDGRQLSFADVAAEGRRRKLEEKRGRHLAMIGDLVPWEDFRPVLEAVWRKAEDERKSAAGRKPWDAVLMFKAIVLGALYNLSDEALEHEMGDRLTFMRFLGLGLEDRIPDATTVWLYRERLARAGIVEKLFEMFDAFLREQGYQAMGGQIIDASIVPVPTQRNSKRGERRDQGGRHSRAGWAEGSANKTGPEGLGRTVDEEKRREPLRLQEPRLDGPAPQAGAPLHGDGRGDPRQPGDRRGCSTRTTRPSLVWGDKAYRSKEIEELLEEPGVQEQDHAEGVGGEEADQTRGAGQQDQGECAGAGGACLRIAGERHGRNTGAQHRGHAGAGPYRLEESCLQHAAPHVPGDRSCGHRVAIRFPDGSVAPGAGPEHGAQADSQPPQSSVASYPGQRPRQCSNLSSPPSLTRKPAWRCKSLDSPRISHYSRSPLCLASRGQKIGRAGQNRTTMCSRNRTDCCSSFLTLARPGTSPHSR